MNPYELAEQEGRTLFEQLLKDQNITTGKPSEGAYTPYDYSFTMDNKTIGVEIKKRNEKYLNEPIHFMEARKAFKLYNLILKGEFDCCIYANFFGDKVAYLYDLKEIANEVKNGNIKIRSVACKRTTAEDTGVIDKSIVKIHTKYGRRYEKTDGKWVLCLN